MMSLFFDWTGVPDNRISVGCTNRMRRFFELPIGDSFPQALKSHIQKNPEPRAFFIRKLSH